MSIKEKYMGESQMKDKPKKKIGFKIADGAVTTEKLADRAVTTEKLANSAVTEDKLADSSVTNSKLAANAVETSHIVDSSVTTEKISNKAVTTDKVSESVIDDMVKPITNNLQGQIDYIMEHGVPVPTQAPIILDSTSTPSMTVIRNAVNAGGNIYFNDSNNLCPLIALGSSTLVFKANPVVSAGYLDKYILWDGEIWTSSGNVEIYSDDDINITGQRVFINTNTTVDGGLSIYGDLSGVNGVISANLAVGGELTIDGEDVATKNYVDFHVPAMDDVPTEGSSNPVKSGGIYDALQNVEIDVDSSLSTTSENPVQNKAVKAALDTKQNTLAFDSAPTASSTNPVTSGGVKTALDAKADNSALATTNSNVAGNATAIANLQALYEGLTQSDIVIVESGDWPLSNLEENTIYRVQGTTSYADYIYNGTSAIKMAEYNNAIDSTPTANSGNLVTSGGVAEAIEGLENIECENILFSDEDITIISSTDEELAKITPEYANFKNLKSNGHDVVTDELFGKSTCPNSYEKLIIATDGGEEIASFSQPEIVALANVRKRINIISTDTDVEILQKFIAADTQGNTDIIFERATYTLSNVYLYMRDTLGWSGNRFGLPVGNNNRYFLNGSKIISNNPTGFSGLRDILVTRDVKGNFEVYDGILVNNGGQYCIHDEGGGYSYAYTHKYFNMSLYYDGTSGQPFGCGTGWNAYIMFKNCIFDTTWTGAVTFSVHGPINNPDNLPVKVDLRIDGCYFHELAPNFNAAYYDGTRDDLLLVISNSEMKGAVTDSNFTIISFNNTIN